MLAKLSCFPPLDRQIQFIRFFPMGLLCLLGMVLHNFSLKEYTVIRSANSSHIVDRILNAIANLILFKAATYVCALGTVVIVLGLYLEVRGVDSLFISGGASAVQNYQLSLGTEARDFLVFLDTGIRFKLQSFGGNHQVLGMLIAVAGPILTTLAICAARTANWLRRHPQLPRKQPM